MLADMAKDSKTIALLALLREAARYLDIGADYAPTETAKTMRRLAKLLRAVFRT
jgi:hypothetical protein